METRQVKAALKAMPIKTDRRDAEGIARLLQMGWFRPVHCKTVSSQETRALLTSRKSVKDALIDMELRPGVGEIGAGAQDERRQIMEDMVAQRRQDPAFAVQHPILDQGLVARLSRTRREALDAVMVEQIGVGLVQHRLVARRLLHRRLDVVGNHDPRRPAHVLEAAHVRGAPVVDLLAQPRLGVEPHCPRHTSYSRGLPASRGRSPRTGSFGHPRWETPSQSGTGTAFTMASSSSESSNTRFTRRSICCLTSPIERFSRILCCGVRA